MQPVHIYIITVILVLALFACGCIQEDQVPAVTPVPPPGGSPHVTPSPAITPYPGAQPLKALVAFGSGEMTGAATVTKYIVRQEYTWTSPAWRSTREQAALAPGNEPQTGYVTQKPAAGNVFLIIYFRVENTGTKAVYAPSPQQVVVSVNGSTSGYRPVSDAGVTIDGITGKQYDYQIGKGGTGGYIQPGASNAAEGYLMYEVPSGFNPAMAYVVANLDYQTRAAWALA